MRAHLLLWVALCGCGDRGTLYREALKPLPLIATPSAIVMVVPQTQRAVVITPGQPTPVGLAISKGAHFAAVVPNSEQLVILTGTVKAPKLDLVDPSTGTVQTLALPGHFDAIHFSPDGRFGVMVYGQSASAATARNLNEIGLLALPGNTVSRMQLDTESLAPTRVLFGPAEPGRQLVALTLERGVAVFDARRPEVAPRRVSIRPQGSSLESVVQETLFSRDGHYLFLRASGLDDVIVVELGAEIGAPVSASINFIAGGRGLADIETPPQGFEGSVLALYSGSREAWLLDARGISDNNKKLSTSAALSRMELLQGPRVLLWDGNARTVTAWDVSDGRSGSAVLDTVFGAPMVVQPLEKGLFPGSAALSVVSVIEETNRLRPRIQAIQLSSSFGASTLDGAKNRLFFAVSNSRALVTMDVRTLQVSEVAFDAQITRVFHVEQGDWVVADHGSPAGDLTVIPAGGTERSSAMRYQDFVLTGDLDRPGDAS